ncbi:MAG TPA: galactose-1-phosphate uridylyltransferase [Firmicutes bacterium]|nr:galactose-1-phosphate uridylyltransferase [Bacillota bacterium]
MSELRWHPLLGQWVINATHRQNRTYKPPADQCPLCPTPSGTPPEAVTEIPVPDFEIAVFQNRFPSLQPAPPAPDVEGTAFYPVRPASGVCEVVVYTADHQGDLGTVGLDRVRNLVEVWADRYRELSALPYVEYVFIFENRGEAVGVTLHHPHGQIYAYPFLPPLMEKELEQCTKHWQDTGRCLGCDILTMEKEGGRVLHSDGSFLTFVPFFARFPFETHIWPLRHVAYLPELTDGERWSLARALQQLVQTYDRLFAKPMPYMMAMHQRPAKREEVGGLYHMHIEFLPLARTATKLKYLAGSESGAGAFITDMSPEFQAENLRAAAAGTPAAAASATAAGSGVSR